MRDPDWYKPHRPPRPPRQPNPGAEVWRLRHPDGRVQSCELRNDSREDAGWDVMLLEDGEVLFSKRCVDERGARYVAQAFKQDTMRCGWVEDEPNETRVIVRYPSVFSSGRFSATAVRPRAPPMPTSVSVAGSGTAALPSLMN